MLKHRQYRGTNRSFELGMDSASCHGLSLPLPFKTKYHYLGRRALDTGGGAAECAGFAGQVPRLPGYLGWLRGCWGSAGEAGGAKVGEALLRRVT